MMFLKAQDVYGDGIYVLYFKNLYILICDRANLECLLIQKWSVSPLTRIVLYSFVVFRI